MIDWPVVATWLKSTVPGIIVLGAIGSIAAVAILRICGFILKRAWNAALPRLIVVNVRPFATGALHMHRFLATGRPVQGIVYAVGAIVGLNIWFVLLALFIVGLLVVVRAQTESLVSVAFLSGAAGYSVLMMVRSFLNVAGIASILFYRDMREVSQILKDPDMVMAFTEVIGNEIQAAKDAADAAVAEAAKAKTAAVQSPPSSPSSAAPAAGTSPPTVPPNSG
jgi:hypothetical protein